MAGADTAVVAAMAVVDFRNSRRFIESPSGVVVVRPRGCLYKARASRNRGAGESSNRLTERDFSAGNEGFPAAARV
jgi:hypothetical protein